MLVVHLVCAAFLAIARRFSGDKFFALAFPPLLAPSLPSATAAGFFILMGFASAAVCVTMRVTREFVSSSSSIIVRLLARLSMVDSHTSASFVASKFFMCNFQNDAMPFCSTRLRVYINPFTFSPIRCQSTSGVRWDQERRRAPLMWSSDKSMAMRTWLGV